jgi:hypothetical protein
MKMENLYWGRIVVALLIVSLAVSTIVFYLKYDNQKFVAAVLKTKLERSEERIQALKTNNDDMLTKVGEKFTIEMFTAVSKEKGQERIERLQNLSTGKAKVKLLESTKTAHSEENEKPDDNLISSIEIKNSHYNKTGEDKAKVIVLFEHLMVSGEYKTRAVNELILDMEYVKGEWLISDYEIQQKI